VYFLNFDSQDDSVNQILSLGSLFQQAFGYAGWDIMTFDNRGAGHSTPKLKCFVNQAAQDAYATGLRQDSNIFGAFDGNFPPTFANIKSNIVRVSWWNFTWFMTSANKSLQSSAYMAKLGRGCNDLYGNYLP
jgi:hypothetical protein